MTQVGLIITILLAATGYVVTYLNGVRLENRKARLKYLSDQIQFLYGPLYSLTHTSQQAWLSFRSKFRPHGAFFSSDAPLTDHELAAWRLWMTEVFMPLNLRIEQAIVDNAHLIEGSDMPKPFVDMISHVEVYRIVLKKWELHDFSEHTAYINYPEEFDNYVATTFKRLTSLQTDLLQSIR